MRDFRRRDERERGGDNSVSHQGTSIAENDCGPPQGRPLPGMTTTAALMSSPRRNASAAGAISTARGDLSRRRASAADVGREEPLAARHDRNSYWGLSTAEDGLPRGGPRRTPRAKGGVGPDGCETQELLSALSRRHLLLRCWQLS